MVEECWERLGMKYIVFTEVQDMEKAMEIGLKLMADREKVPGKYPKRLFPNHAFMDTSPSGKWKGFAVVEGTPEQLANWVTDVDEAWSLKYVPIVETNLMVELYQKLKK
jgi:hypothetical protein